MRYIFSLMLLLGFGFLNPAAGSIEIKLGGTDITPDGGTGEGKTLGSDALILTFTDSLDNALLADNEVNLNLFFKGAGAGSGAKIKDVLLNFKSNDKPSNFDVKSSSGSFKNGSFGSFKYGSNGNFDIKIDFFTSNSKKFARGHSIDLMFSVHDSLSLRASDFNYFSSDDKFLAAMHMNETGNGNSGHYGSTFGGVGDQGNPVPEPSTVAIWSLIGIGAVGYSVRRRKQARGN